MGPLPSPSPSLPLENIDTTPAKLWTRGPFRHIQYLIESMSTTSLKRNPPHSHKTQHVRLITIGPSHYCEKVRWGLDLVEADPTSPLYYTEDAHPPLFASIETLKVSGGKASMTPMVVYSDVQDETAVANDASDGRGIHVINEQEEVKSDESKTTTSKSNSNAAMKNPMNFMYDSTQILRHFCPFLYPNPIEAQILQIEEYLDMNLGATIRCVLYYHLFSPSYLDVLGRLITCHSSWIESALWKRLLHGGYIEGGMKYAMKINEHTAQRSLETIRAVVDKLSHQLIRSDGSSKSHLMDTDTTKYGFTAADLTLSALVGPLLGSSYIPELQHFQPVQEEELPPTLLLLRREIGESVVGLHVRKMYRQHRMGAGDKVVEPKVVCRDRLPLAAYVVAGSIVFQVSRKLRSRL